VGGGGAGVRRGGVAAEAGSESLRTWLLEQVVSHTYRQTRTHICVCVCVRACVCVCVHAYVHVCMCVGVCVYIYMWVGRWVCMCVYVGVVYTYVYVCIRVCTSCMPESYGVASISRIDKIIGLFWKRALEKRLYSAKETYNFIDPTNRSHPIAYRRHDIYIK